MTGDTKKSSTGDENWFRRVAEDESLKEDQKRLLLRQEMTKQNKHLAGVAKQAGVVQSLDYEEDALAVREGPGK